MEPFASVDDLSTYWPGFDASDASARATAEQLLAYASAVVRRRAPEVDAQVADGSMDPIIPKMIVCAMVKRAMLAQDLEGVSQDQQTAGPFGMQRTYGNPMGNIYLSAEERRLLGVGAQVAFMIDTTPPLPDAECGPFWWSS